MSAGGAAAEHAHPELRYFGAALRVGPGLLLPPNRSDVVARCTGPEMMSKAACIALALAIPGFVGYPAELAGDQRKNISAIGRASEKFGTLACTNRRLAAVSLPHCPERGGQASVHRWRIPYRGIAAAVKASRLLCWRGQWRVDPIDATRLADVHK